MLLGLLLPGGGTSGGCQSLQESDMMSKTVYIRASTSRPEEGSQVYCALCVEPL
jgi:hypothetical protein